MVAYMKPFSDLFGIPLNDLLNIVSSCSFSQESLLNDLHLQISSGAASKKVEEQIWEQQRIVTQLKVCLLPTVQWNFD